MERHLFNTRVQSTYSIHITLESGACDAHYLFEASEMFLFIYLFIGCTGSSLLDAGFL